MITIIDYGLGNLGSIKNMFKKIGVDALITNNHSEINAATKLILPGVGAFDNGVSNLKQFGLIDLLNKKVLQEKTPILGICLGMQLMTKNSEEGMLPGLGWIDSETVKFKFDNTAKKYTIPHMGWAFVSAIKSSKLFNGMYVNPRFYFVHSYYVKCNQTSDTLLQTNYSHDFVSGFEKDNIIGVQFHPEKSHKYGMLLLKNFIELY